MQKHFNTAGPSKAHFHYLLDPLARIDQVSIKALIDQERYFVLHAPRQTGKTTCLLALRDWLNAEGSVVVAYANVESAQAARSNVAAAMAAIASVLSEKLAEGLGQPQLQVELRQQSERVGAEDRLRTLLRMACEASPKPLVLFLDEVDALVGDTLISLLRQIRAGYTDRPKYFPQTIVLCGVRDVRDYRMTLPDGEVITGGSAFNIKAESLRLGDFSHAEMVALYAQHTEATGQVFTSEALDIAWESTQGQPWLVNALAEQAVWKQKAHWERSIVIDEEKMRAAREALILRHDTHLDQLTDKLREERVRRVIEPMLMGENSRPSLADRQYLLDLGLIRVDANKDLVVANSIYAEVLPRVLNTDAQDNIHSDRILPSWRDAQGRLDPRQFLLNFQDFWRAHGETMLGTVPYHEAAPHLVLMAYLQRVINGGGRIEREYAAGSGRLDLLLVYGSQRMAIEVKVWRDSRPDPLIEGLEQIERYLLRLQLDQGFLVIFDRRSSAPEWTSRMTQTQTRTASGKPVLVLRG